MEHQINNIYNVQLHLLLDYLKISNQLYDPDKISFCVNLSSKKNERNLFEYQLSYLDYKVCGLLSVENEKIQTELCREIHVGKEKITITRHDRGEEYQTSAYVSIQCLSDQSVERFHIWFEDGIWLPLVTTPEELRTYKVGREKEKTFLKVKEK